MLWYELADLANDFESTSTRRYRYNCGGHRTYSGPCGASDCGSCRNGTPPWEEEEEEEEEE